MNKQKFLQEIRPLLFFMPPEDQEKTMQEFEALFERAGPEGEQALLNKLGSPVKLVVLLEKEYRRHQEEQEEKEGVTRELPVVDHTAEIAALQEAGNEEDKPAEEEASESVSAETEEEETRTARGKRRSPPGRRFLAVLFTVIALPLTLIALVLALCVFLIPGGPGAAAGAAGVYLGVFSIGQLQFLPDILLLVGAGLICLALALILLWAGLCLLLLGVRLIFRLLQRSYSRILYGKGGTTHG